MPLIGQISQPFDEALFMWVQSQTDSDGLTKVDVELFNQEFWANGMQDLPYKPVRKEPQNADVLIKNGMHIMQILKANAGVRKVVLDYAFGSSAPKSGDEIAAVSSADKDASSGMVKYPKTINGLFVRN